MPLHVVKFIVEDSIEERIGRIIEEKQSMMEEYIEDGGLRRTTEFSHEDLVRVLGLGTGKC
jgi:SNF2 family DNA or RNA helicase